MTPRSTGPQLDQSGASIILADDGPDLYSAEIEFRQLRYFVAAAEEMHFGRAAAGLFISQPALSQAIARLEQALDARLFERTRHSVELTDAGREMFDSARRLLAEKDDIVEHVRRVGRGESGVVRVGLGLAVESEVAPALAALAIEWPEIVVDRFAAASERVLALLRDGAVHVALVNQLPALASFDRVESELLRCAPLAILASQTSPLAGRDSVTLAELSDETFLQSPRTLAPSAFDGLKILCLTYGGFEPKILESLSGTPTLPHDWRPITDGTAIVILPEGAARAIRPDGIAVVRIAGPPGARVALAWRRGSNLPVVERFIAFMRAFREAHVWASDLGDR